MAQINDVIDADTAQIVAEDLGHKVRRVSDSDVEDAIVTADDDEGDKTARPPVVTVMGMLTTANLAFGCAPQSQSG